MAVAFFHHNALLYQSFNRLNTFDCSAYWLITLGVC